MNSLREKPTCYFFALILSPLFISGCSSSTNTESINDAEMIEQSSSTANDEPLVVDNSDVADGQ